MFTLNVALTRHDFQILNNFVIGNKLLSETCRDQWVAQMLKMDRSDTIDGFTLLVPRKLSTNFWTPDTK